MQKYTSSGTQLLHVLLMGMTDKLSVIRQHLSLYGAREKMADRALLNVEDGIACALVALETNATKPYGEGMLCAQDLVMNYTSETREDIVRIHDLFHEEADNEDTPVAFRFSVEALVMGYNTIMTAGKYALMERMAEPSATDVERKAVLASLHRPQASVMGFPMDPQQLFNLFKNHPPTEDPDA